MDNFQGVVSLDFSTSIFILINFVLVYIIVKKLLYKPVKKVIEDRENEIKDQYKLAEEAKQNAYDLEKHYDLLIKNAKDEAAKIIRDAKTSAKLQSEEILEKANKSSVEIIKKANVQIELDKRKMVNQVKDDMSDIVVMAVNKVINKNFNAQDQNIMINDIIDSLKEGDMPCQPQ